MKTTLTFIMLSFIGLTCINAQTTEEKLFGFEDNFIYADWGTYWNTSNYSVSTPVSKMIIYHTNTIWDSYNRNSAKYWDTVMILDRVHVNAGIVACRLVSKHVEVGKIFPGLITSGKLNDTIGSVNISSPSTVGIVDRRANFYGYYKYFPQGSDQCLISVTLYTDINCTNVLASGTFTTNTTQSNWTMFEIPLNYLVSTTNPVKAIVTIMSSDVINHSSDATHGSTLIVDAMNFSQIINPDAGILYTGISEIKKNNEFSVYPNPAEDVLSVSFNNTNSSKQVKLYNYMGKVVYQSSVNSKDENIDMTNYSKGIYFIEVIVNNMKSTEKIVLQ